MTTQIVFKLEQIAEFCENYSFSENIEMPSVSRKEAEALKVKREEAKAAQRAKER